MQADQKPHATRKQKQEMSMKKFVSIVLVALFFAGSTGLANAKPYGGKKLHDIVNFWEQSSFHTD